MKRKTFFIAGSVLVFLGLYAFWDRAIAYAAKLYFDSYCLNCFGAEMQYTLDFQGDGRLIFDKLSLATPEPLEGGGLVFSAEKADVCYAFHPFTRQLDLEITVDKPSLELSQQTDIQALLERLFSKASFFQVKPCVTVNEGVAALIGDAVDAAKSHRVYWNGALDLKSNCIGSLSISVDDPSRETNSFKFSFCQDDKKECEMEAIFHQVDFGFISEAMGKHYLPFENWIAEQGIIDGTLNVKKEKGKRFEAAGKMLIKELLLKNTRTHFTAKVGEASLDLRRGADAGHTTVGVFEIIQDALFSFEHKDAPVWEVRGVRGKIAIESHDGAKVDIQGDCDGAGHAFHFHLSGDGRYFGVGQTFLKLKALFQGPEGGEAVAQIDFKQLNGLWHTADLQLRDFGHRQFQFVQEAMRRFYKGWGDVRVYEGTVDMSAAASIKGFSIHNLDIGAFSAKNVVFDYYPWNIDGRIGEAKGGMTVDPGASDFLSTLNTELVIDDGLLRISGVGKKPLELTKIHTKLACSHGVIEASVAEGSFAGLDGTVQLDFLSENDVAKVKFSGAPKGIASLFPQKIVKGIEDKFSEDAITLSARMKIIPEGVHIEGLFEVDDRYQRRDGEIAFGFDIEKVRECPGEAAARKKGKFPFSLAQQIGMEILEKTLPAVASPALILNKRQAAFQEGISGFLIRNGWFYAENLSFAKYVEPFAFQTEAGQGEPILALGGIGNFRGSFNHLGMGLSYEARDFSVESRDFSFQVENFCSADSREKDCKVWAAHYFDFLNGNHFGKMPVKHGSYLQKNSGLQFTEVSAELMFEGRQIHATELDLFCQGIHFAGNINIDNSSQEYGVFDVEILADTMDGKISQVQRFFSHFEKPLFFTGFPLEGDLRFKNQGGYFVYKIRPEGSTVQTRLEAALTDGTISFAPLDMSLRELELNIHYDQEKNIFLMDDIQGTVLVGPPGSVEEYLLAGDKIAFSDFENNIGSFDLWVGDKKRDIIRVAGRCEGAKDLDNGIQKVAFYLDHSLSHFGDVFPKQFALSLENWTKVEDFQLNLDLKLDTLLSDLQRISRSGIFFLSPGTLKELNEFDAAKGTFHIQLDYDKDIDTFRYESSASGIAFGPYSFDQMRLSGSVKDKMWSVDEFRIDDISVAADLSREEKCWRVNFLGLKSGGSLLLGLEGSYDNALNKFDAKVNLCEINFDALHEWPQLATFIAANKPSGLLKGKGKLCIERLEKSRSWRCDATFAASSQGVAFRGLPFADAEGFSCHFISDKGLTFRNIKTAFLPPKRNGEKAAVNFEKIAYDRQLEELEFDGVHFIAPHSSLKWLPGALQKAFPDSISQRTEEIIAGLKKSGSLIGDIFLKVQPGKHCFKLSLADGGYFYEGSEHKISNFSLLHQPDNLLISTNYRYQDRLLKLKFHSIDPHREGGGLLVSDGGNEEGAELKNAIALQWEDRPGLGFKITEAKGAIQGLQLHLTKNYNMFMDPNHHNLEGWVQLSFPQALNLFDPELRKSILECKIGGSFLFNGNWSIGSANYLDSEFTGRAEAKNFIFKGYRLEALQGHVDYAANRAAFKDLTITDPSGVMTIPALSLNCRNSEPWELFIPEAIVKKFRPSYLKEVEAKSSSIGKSFVMPKVEIFNLKGQLSDNKTWTGEGKMTFKNPPRTSLQNTIFAIPHEIITRIGLNPAVLTPVTGTVFYEIKNGKIVITKFKDVFSESHASKFYLPRSSQESYVDFDKNLHVQVRMKQYNLLFKIAELFTFTIKGTLEKPIYTIQKQQ